MRNLMYGTKFDAALQAEEEYQRFKKICDENPEMEKELSKKLWWYLYWNMSTRDKEDVEKYINKPDSEGRVLVHHLRPNFIWPPPGGDKFDRGEVPERIEVPL